METRTLPDNLVLLSGAHDSPDNGFCIMEAVAWVAGEPFSDHPQCACHVISTFLRQWNDSLPDDKSRTRLLAPLIPKIIGTRSTPEVELVRVMLCVDWTCREFTPTWLETVPALVKSAATLRACKPIQCWEDLDVMLAPLRDSQQKSSAARAAARDAAWDAARDAAWAAAWDAARDAAWAAAWAAARDALRPTTHKLQLSAVALVERMCAIK